MSGSRMSLVTVLVMTLFGVAASAQTTGSIFGTVRDESGAVVPNAVVTVENEPIRLVRSGAAGQDGTYSFPVLPVGTYTIRVEAPGFAIFYAIAIRVELNQQVRVDITLRVGAREEQITVQAEIPLVDTVTATLGEIVGEREIVDLPLAGRNFLQLATLQPGVTPATIEYQPSVGSKLLDQLASTTSQVNGLRIQSNNYLLDGGDNNEPFYGFIAATPNPDAVQEFKILTNSYTAEFGRGGGGVVNVITRSGTNSFHGTLYEFFRNDVLDATNFFAREKARLKQNQFGGSLGGPILQDKLFFFVNYEGLRNREGVTVNTTVPSALERTGNFSASNPNPTSCNDPGAVCDPTTGLPFVNNIIPSARIHPIARALIDFYPPATDGNRQFVASIPAPKDANQFMVKVDQNLRERDRLTYTYAFNEISLVDPNPQTSFGRIGIPGFDTRDKARFQRFVVTETHTFGPSAINTFRATYNRAVINTGRLVHERSRFDYGFSYLSRKLEDLPLVQIVGISPFGTSNAVDFLRTNSTYQLTDDLSLVKGRHTLKFGADLRRLTLRNDNLLFEPGGFQFTAFFTRNALADFLLGKPLAFLQLSGDNLRYWSATHSYFYAQDDIRITKDLTLNVGLRYELFGPFTEEQDRMTTIRPGEVSNVRPQFPRGMLVPGDVGVPRATIDTDLNNFAPRIGLAWDPFGKGSTSVRAAYGIFYDNVIGFIPWQLLIFPGLNASAFLFAPADFADPFQGNSPFAGTGPVPIVVPTGQINTLNHDFRTPYVQQWNFTLQHGLTKDLMVQAAYVGTKGTKLVGSHDLNRAVFVPGNTTAGNIQSRRPLQEFGAIRTLSTDFNSSYHSLQLSVKQRMSHGLSFLGAYTWSKVIDYVSIVHSGFRVRGQTVSPQNESDFASERGLAAFDVRQRFVLSFLWEVPGHRQSDLKSKVLGRWTLSGIVAVQSGTPFSAVDSTNPVLDGASVLVARPDLVPGCSLDRPSGVGEIQQFFNTACFAAVPRGAGLYGTAGRNIIIGPGLANVDLGLFKDIPIDESKGFQFRIEVFNLFNHPNFALPENDIRSPIFGQILNTIPGNERKIQFGLKFYF